MDAASLARWLLVAATIAGWVGASATSEALVSNDEFLDTVSALQVQQSVLTSRVAGGHSWEQAIGTNRAPEVPAATPPQAAGKQPISAQALGQNRSTGSLAMSPPTPQAEEWPGPLRVAAGVLAASIGWLMLVLLQSIGESDDIDAASLPVQSSPGIFFEAFLVMGAACTLAIDSTTAAVVVPILPELSGDSGSVLLFFIRPAIASTTAMVLLPAWIPKGAAWGHFITAVGLLFLASSCLCFATATSVLPVLCGQILHAIASATIFVSVIHTRIQEAAVGRIGLHLGATLGGMAVGHGCAPWLGSTLHEVCGIPAMFVILAWMAAFACCLHIGVFKHEVAPSSEPKAITDTPSHAKQSATLRLISRSLLQKRLMLLGGVALAAAVVALHSIAVPLYLQSLDKADERTLSIWQGTGSLALFLAIISTGVIFDNLGIRSVIFGMVVALVLSILGLRFLVMPSARHELIPIGLIASFAGVGMHLGLAVPLYARLAICTGGKTDHTSISTVDPMASGMLGACWYLGDVLGVGGQLLLCPLVGVKLTILAFACALALHAAGLALWPGWQVRRGRSKRADINVQQWLESSSCLKDSTC